MMPGKRILSAVRNPRYSIFDLALFLGVSATVALVYIKVVQEKLYAAAFQNPLAQVRVAEEEITPDSHAYQREYDFTVNWFTWNIPVWQEVMRPYQGKPELRYLEVGAYEGRSVMWMLENVLTDATARATVIDIFDGPYKDRYFANLERSGAADKVTSVANYSQLALREAPLDSFDIIYIDGSHAKDDVLEDAVLCWRLLKEGGVLIFDDYRWAGFFASGTNDEPTDFPKTAIDPFVQCFEEHFDVIHNSYQLILKKKTSQVVAKS